MPGFNAPKKHKPLKPLKPSLGCSGGLPRKFPHIGCPRESPYSSLSSNGGSKQTPKRKLSTKDTPTLCFGSSTSQAKTPLLPKGSKKKPCTLVSPSSFSNMAESPCPPWCHPRCLGARHPCPLASLASRSFLRPARGRCFRRQGPPPSSSRCGLSGLQVLLRTCGMQMGASGRGPPNILGCKTPPNLKASIRGVQKWEDPLSTLFGIDDGEATQVVRVPRTEPGYGLGPLAPGEFRSWTIPTPSLPFGPPGCKTWARLSHQLQFHSI